MFSFPIKITPEATSSSRIELALVQHNNMGETSAYNEVLHELNASIRLKSNLIARVRV